MLQSRTFKSCCGAPLCHQLAFFQNCRFYSSHSGNDNEADLDAVREWYKKFSKSKIPVSIAKTTFSRSSGPGGQKVNKTSSKATTVWPFHALALHVPKALHQGLRTSRYYVSSSDSLTIQCDTSRSQSENEGETHKRLAEEIDHIYRKRVPGVTPPEQKKKIEQLHFNQHRNQALKAEIKRIKLEERKAEIDEERLARKTGSKAPKKK